MSSISEFNKARQDKEYYTRLVDGIAKLNEELNAFNNINSSIAGGFPFSVKDNICVKDVESTASSRILKGYKPPFNATVVERMLGKGFGFLGKTNMDEFGFGSFGLNSEKPARNPFDKERVAGGSSSGAAVATSVLKYHVAIAESTGGSISAPASFCGVVGFTPTYGTVSRYGLIDYANSLDKIGVMARSASDIKEVFGIIKGKDRYDATCIDMHDALPKDPKKLFVVDNLVKDVDKSVKASFEKALDAFGGMGYSIEHVQLGELDAAIPVYYIIAMAEASTNLAKYAGFKFGRILDSFSKEYNEFFTEARELFGQEAKRRIVLGTYVRSASVRNKYYYKALQIRRLIGKRMMEVLKDGFMMLPAMPILPPKISDALKLTPLQTYMLDVLTVPANLTGMPHISMPTGYAEGLPVGTQIIGMPYTDNAIIGIAEEWEKVFNYRFKYNLGSL